MFKYYKKDIKLVIHSAAQPSHDWAATNPLVDFDVNANGWVQLKSQSNANGRKQTLNNTAPCARVEANGLTTFTIDLANASLFGTGALAENVTAEVTQNVSPYQTVYADVTRSGSASISVIFSGSVAVDIYRVLLTHV